MSFALVVPCTPVDLAPTVYAAISSLSLSLLATGIDSVFDIGSNILLMWLHKKAARLDTNKWPVGGSRLETIGNIIYGKSLSGRATTFVLTPRIRISVSCLFLSTPSHI